MLEVAQGLVELLFTGDLLGDIELAADLPRFLDTVARNDFNGIVGNVRNYFDLDATELMQRMLRVAREDVKELLARVEGD